MVSASAKSDPRLKNREVLTEDLGCAAVVTLLLADWEKYSLSERVAYHFHLTEALADSHRERADHNQSNAQHRQSDPVCGLVSILECVPSVPWHRLTRKKKRALKNELLNFNIEAQTIREEQNVYCHEPATLPLRLNPTSRVYFVYETTRIAFCVDASPTLTSTFGASDDGSVCPIDRIATMAKTFFKALVEPISVPSPNNNGFWRPLLSVTVIAVYPRLGGDEPPTSLLVRDFRITGEKAVDLLAAQIHEWALNEVEFEIAKRLANRKGSGLPSGYDSWTMPSYSSSLHDILEAGDVSLSTLSSAGRPCIVIATDGRSVACGSVMDIVSDASRNDVPLVILDLSCSKLSDNSIADDTTGYAHLMNSDPGGANFPLHFSDDAEALYNVCKATEGCFFDQQMLEHAATTKAGSVSPDSPLVSDGLFAFKRHTIKPNAVQWYVLYSLSPLTPTFHGSWGKLAPPECLRQKLLRPGREEQWFHRKADQRFLSAAKINEPNQNEGSLIDPLFRGQEFIDLPLQRKHQERSMISTYIINPVRIQGILLMRVKEGFRAQQYGQSTNDPDKVFIQFTLSMDHGIVLHYELLYRALSSHNHMVGYANIKVEISGNSSFIQAIKDNFVHQAQRIDTGAKEESYSARFCNILRWIRNEDMLQSYLSPTRWSNQLASPSSPFVKRLGSLTQLQRQRHFRFDQFDCVCVGRMPYAQDDGFLSEFRDIDDGEIELRFFLANWATQCVVASKRFVRRMETSEKTLTSYCVIELSRSESASRLYTVSVETFGSRGASDRLALLSSLKNSLGSLRDVRVLRKQIGQFLVGIKERQTPSLFMEKSQLLESQHSHATWDLVNDPELLPLLMRRRTEIGNFLLLESSDNHALFAKLSPEDYSQNNSSDPGDLVQYQLVILADKVVVDFHMESEGGRFFPFRNESRGQEQNHTSRFSKMMKTLKKRDQECGRALRSRTSLLRVFDKFMEDEIAEESHLTSVERLLAYSSQVSVHLRYFGTNECANSILESLTIDLLLSLSKAKVAKLVVDSDSMIEGLQGFWFLIEFDKQTISITNFASTESLVLQKDGTDSPFREVTFFTIGISDLYSRRDDVADDGSEDDHISEHLCVSDFSDHLLAAHSRNFAFAAYSALRSVPKYVLKPFGMSDYSKVTEVLSFIEMASIVVPGEAPGAGESSKLVQIVQSVLEPIPDDDHCFFYKGSDCNFLDYSMTNDDNQSEASVGPGSVGTASSNELSTNTSESDTIATAVKQQPGRDDNSIDSSQPELPSRSLGTPIFVRLQVDGVALSLWNLSTVKTSTTLTVQLSFFKNPDDQNISGFGDLSTTHSNVALELKTLFNAYVSERTLERLLYRGALLKDQDIRLAKECLRKARNVNILTLDVFFYSGKIDSMVSAPTSLLAGSTLDEGARLLNEDLRANSILKVKATSVGSLVVFETERGCDVFKYWCFLKIRASRGIVDVELYHPSGLEESEKVMKNVQELINTCCFRVNQRLLLRHLHSSRTASELLIPSDNPVKPKPEIFENGQRAPFAPGLLQCPVVFTHTFDLFHRCATNPLQVARTLESTVLHIFALSNRIHVFVYKDEAGAIFYMNLLTEGGGIEGNGTIQLIVRGVHHPGPSVTEQLTTLLRKKLMTIGAEMLSSVLVKNPEYFWRGHDLSFVRSFRREWEVLDAPSVPHSSNDRVYRIPNCITDPGMVLLFFRQNLCGSTYFHPLKSQEWASFLKDSSESNNASEKNSSSTEFVFFYNNAPSKLDPKFQGLSTLTVKGAELSRKMGSGVAIVQVSLVDKSGNEIREITFLDPPDSVTSFSIIRTDSARVSCVDSPLDTSFNEMTPDFSLIVRICPTELRCDVLHEWILLTFNQAATAWGIEKHLDKSVHRVGRDPPSNDRTLIESSSRETLGLSLSEIEKANALERLYPGLPALSSLLQASLTLPHPAVLQAEHNGVIRSSFVADVALDLLENTLLDHLRNELKQGIPFDFESDLHVIRLSRTDLPQRVSLSWDSGKKSSVRLYTSEGRGMRIRDAPIDCPEYLCIYCFPEGQRRPDTFSSLKLSEQVVVGDVTTDSDSYLSSVQTLKEIHAPAFRRSFAFIFSVKRNRRYLLAYNWNPHVFRVVASQLKAKDLAFLLSTDRSVASLQLRSLKYLSPCFDNFHDTYETRNNLPTLQLSTIATKADQKRVPVNTKDRFVATEHPKAEKEALRKPPRRAVRPISIRRPNLIGRSMDGAAVHAVAASRARASSNHFRGNPGGSGIAGKVAFPKATPDDQSNSKLPRGSSTVRSLGEKATAVSSMGTARDPPRESVGLRSEMDLHLTQAKGRHRKHMVHTETLRLRVFDSWHESASGLSCSLIDSILSESIAAWNNASEASFLPDTLEHSFVESFVQQISGSSPTFKVAKVVGTGNDSSVYLVGETKSVRGCKLFTAIRLSFASEVIDGMKMKIVRCDSWVLSLPRKESLITRRSDRHNYQSRLLSERDSTGADVLSVIGKAAFSLESIVLDFLALVAKNSVKKAVQPMYKRGVLDVLKRVTTRYELKQQVKMQHLNYNIFKASVVLKSYGDRMINMFDAPSLFKWLMQNAASQRLLPSGPTGLCLDTEIQVQDTITTCFITYDLGIKGSVDLILLCRRYGRNLYDFMFRNNSKIASSVADNIAIECAGLIFDLLQSAARCLYRDDLWGRFSSPTQNLSRMASSSDDIVELLGLCTATPVGDILMKGDSAQVTLIFEEFHNHWSALCYHMERDSAFLPSWKLCNDRQIFYCVSEKVFFLVDSNVGVRNGCFGIHLIERDTSKDISVEGRRATQKLINFVLHFGWQIVI